MKALGKNKKKKSIKPIHLFFLKFALRRKVLARCRKGGGEGGGGIPLQKSLFKICIEEDGIVKCLNSEYNGE